MIAEELQVAGVVRQSGSSGRDPLPVTNRTLHEQVLEQAASRWFLDNEQSLDDPRRWLEPACRTGGRREDFQRANDTLSDQPEPFRTKLAARRLPARLLLTLAEDLRDARKSRRIEHRQVTYVAGSARAAA